MNITLIGPCRICTREGVSRLDNTETDLCAIHAVDAVERGDSLFITRRGLKACEKEGEKRLTQRQWFGWS